MRNKQELRALKQDLLRSNTRGVYKTDQDDLMVAGNAEVQRIAAAIEERRIELGKTSGFERMYARVTRLYFGGMAQHLSELRRVLRPGANLAYVVGDQASYLQVMIRTGQILADIAESLGYECVGIDLFPHEVGHCDEGADSGGGCSPPMAWPDRLTLEDIFLAKKNIYTSIIERIFQTRYTPGLREVDFEREDLTNAATELGLAVPKNLGDLIYTFRYRSALPDSIQNVAAPRRCLDYPACWNSQIPICPRA